MSCETLPNPASNTGSRRSPSPSTAGPIPVVVEQDGVQAPGDAAGQFVSTGRDTQTRSFASGRLLHAVVTLLTYDFCPWANRFVSWSRKPLGFLVITAFLAVCFAVFLNVYAWMVVAGLSVVLALGTVWPWLALRGLDGQLSWDASRAREGEPVRVRLCLRNRFPWPVWGVAIHGGFRQADTATALSRVSGFADVTFSWEFTPTERGVYPTEPPVMETGFPFGLWSARRAIRVKQQLLVWPRTLRLNGLPDLTESQPSEEHLTDRRAGDLGDLLGTRLFRQGDSLRRIHWSQSARHQRLIATERQGGVEARVRVRIDATAAHHVGTGPNSSLNWTLRFAASICELLSSEHAHVDCVLGSEVICLSHPGGLRRLMDKLARVPESGIETAQVSAVPTTAAGCEIHCTTDRSSQCAHRHVATPRGHRDIVLATAECQPDGSLSGILGIGSDKRPPSLDLSPGLVTGDGSGPEHQVRSQGAHRPGLAGERKPGKSRHRPWLLIDSSGDIAAVFQRQWRHACRVA